MGGFTSVTRLRWTVTVESVSVGPDESRRREDFVSFCKLLSIGVRGPGVSTICRHLFSGSPP